MAHWNIFTFFKQFLPQLKKKKTQRNRYEMPIKRKVSQVYILTESDFLKKLTAFWINAVQRIEDGESYVETTEPIRLSQDFAQKYLGGSNYRDLLARLIEKYPEYGFYIEASTVQFVVGNHGLQDYSFSSGETLPTNTLGDNNNFLITPVVDNNNFLITPVVRRLVKQPARAA